VVIRDARGLSLHVFHQSIEIVARIGDADDADGGSIPQATGIEFGNGDVKAGAQTIFQTAQHLPLVFERLRCFDVQFEGEKGDQEQFPVSSF